MTKKTNLGGRKAAGRDYSKPLIELLPAIISKKAKTIPEIADEAQRSSEVVRTLIGRIRNESGGIHIKSWKRGLYGGAITPCYLFGKGEDAKKPKPYTRQACVNRYQQTDKGKSAKNRYLAKRKGMALIIDRAINADPLMAMLYGSHRNIVRTEGDMNGCNI